MDDVGTDCMGWSCTVRPKDEIWLRAYWLGWAGGRSAGLAEVVGWVIA